MSRTDLVFPAETFSRRKFLKLRRIELHLTSSANRILLGQAEARLEFRLPFFEGW